MPYYEPCDHDCDEECEWYGCHHEHCFNCDDYQTYNLRPAETGAAEDA